MKNIFNNLTLGNTVLANRVVMAPLTRCRSDKNLVPTNEVALYYEQRASAGLIISEASPVSAQAVGYTKTPGIFSKEQVRGWKSVTNRVRKAGGKIVLQLWHVGRISHSDFKNGELPVAPSAIRPAGIKTTPKGRKEFEIPHALTISEIQDIIGDFKKAADRKSVV